MKPRLAAASLLIATVLAAAACAAADIRPAEPADLTVTAAAGRIALPDGKDGLFACRFRPDAAKEGAEVVMAWNVAGPTTVTIPWPGGKAAVIDMLGREKELVPRGGKLSVEAGPCPVYLK